MVFWKTFFHSIVALASFTLMAAPGRTQSAPGSARRALLIGVHAYAHGPDSTFPDLAGPPTDVAVIRDVLLRKFQFPSVQVRSLTSAEDTTRAAILAAMHALIAQTHKGDVVYIHFSGHGSQVADVTSPDLVDSTLVPSDWVRDGRRDIRSREVAALLADLDAKSPANVTLTFDCCHSGTITRGGRMPVRGVDYETRYGVPPPRPPAAPGGQGAFAAVLPVVAAPGTRGGGAAPPEYVVISACRNDQAALECEDDQHRKMGRLTFLLARALTEAGPETTYQSLFDRLNDWMGEQFPHSLQDPQISGRERGQRVLDGTALPPRTYISVRTAAGPGQTPALTLLAGAVLGVTQGSVYALYASPSVETAPSPTFTDADKLAEARVTAVRTTDATLEITHRLRSSPDLGGACAVEVSHNYGDQRIKVRPADFQVLPHGAEVAARVAALPGVNTHLEAADAPDVVVQRATPPWLKAHPDAPAVRPGDFVLVRQDGGALLAALTPTGDLAAQVERALDRESRWQRVNRLNNESGWSLPITARLIPALPPRDTNEAAYRGDLPGPPNPRTVREGDWATLEVTDTGVEDAYITVLDLTSDGGCEQLWPARDDNILNNFVRAGETRRLWVGSRVDATQLIGFTPPAGREIYKVIATDRHIDFTPLLSPGGVRGPVDDSPLALLLLSSVGGPVSRSALAVPPKDWATATLSFEVQPSGH